MSERKPGDDILDHSMPGADKAAREEVRANLTAFMAVMLRIAEREADEALSQPTIRALAADSVESRV